MKSLLLFLLFLSPAWAGEVRLSLDDVPAYTRLHHPQLAVARARLDEARGRWQQSARLSNPELELDYTRHTTGREGSVGVSFTQRFPLTARLRHEKAASQALVAAAEAEVRDAERTLAAEASATAVRLLALGSQRALRAEQLANSRELARFLTGRLESGEASAVDAAQGQLEGQQIEIESLQLAAEEAVLLGELRPLLGFAGNDRVQIVGPLPAPAKTPAASTSTRPDIAAATARTEAARSTVREQQARRWDDVGVGLSYTRARELDEPEGTETEHVLGVRFTLPLPLWNDNAGRLREARAAATRAEQEQLAVQRQASAEATGAREAMQAQARLVEELDRQVLPAAQQIEEQLRQSFTTGQAPLTDVLRARARRLELQRTRLDALRDYQLARVRYRAATASFPSSK